MALDGGKWSNLLYRFILRLITSGRQKEGSILLFDCRHLAFSGSTLNLINYCDINTWHMGMSAMASIEG